MGHLERFAQRTLADETERITGAAGWQDPPEICSVAWPPTSPLYPEVEVQLEPGLRK